VTTRVSRRAKSYQDRAGDPLDGLVNLFDLAIVLGVAFLLAALASLRLTGVLGGQSVAVVQTPGSNEETIIVKNGSTLQVTHLTNEQVAGQGTRLGTVYRLQDGRLVLVQNP
jgi:hypothetical protein